MVEFNLEIEDTPTYRSVSKFYPWLSGIYQTINEVILTFY